MALEGKVEAAQAIASQAVGTALEDNGTWLVDLRKRVSKKGENERREGLKEKGMENWVRGAGKRNNLIRCPLLLLQREEELQCLRTSIIF